jgi:hypothetical protein
MKKISSLLVLSLFVFTPIAVGHGGHDHSKEAATSSSGEHQHPANPGQPTIKAFLVKMEDQGDKKLVQIKLSKIKDDQPITLNDLKEVHTQKIHLLIINDSLTDYQHIHPEATQEAGVYQFAWTPKTKGNYKLWADLVPMATNAQQYVVFELVKNEQAKTTIDKKVFMETTVDSYTFKLSFEKDKLTSGTPVMGKIVVSDSKGEPVKTLEPIMGAYAHIVGFSEDLHSVVHIHPMGTEPTNESDHGGPELTFHIEPNSTGFIKLFAQVKLSGKEIFAPFGIMVESK